MRLLHTSDWHLGHKLYNYSREPEHRQFLTWLVAQIEHYAVDAVLVAGDVFDTGTPPSYARTLYYDFIATLHQHGIPLVLLAGNHDSPATLGESQSLLARFGTRVIASTTTDPAKQVLVLPNRKGTAGVVLCAIPFMRPQDLCRSQANQSPEDKQHALHLAIQQHYHAVYQAAVARRNALGGRLPIVATGHLTVLGAQLSDSEREIYIGTLQALPVTAFPPVDYLALGHLHRAQAVGGHAHIRYSGSPIPLSFSEASQSKEVLLVDFSAEGLTAITPLSVPCFQPLRRVQGSLATLPAALQAACEQATADLPVWLEVTVEEDDTLHDLNSRLQPLLLDVPAVMLRLRRARPQAALALSLSTAATLEELDPFEVFAKRLALESDTLSDASRQQLIAHFKQVVDDVHAEPSA